MALLSPPGFVQGGTYTARLDRVFRNTNPSFPDLATSVGARQGFYSGRAPTFSNPSGWTITIGACAGLIANTFVANAGDYQFTNDGTVSTSVAASSPTLNRQDIVGFQVKDTLYDASGLNTIVPAVIQGTSVAGASGDPTLPASFIPVLRAVVGANSTSPTLQSLVRYTTNDGGAVRVGSVAERDAIVPWSGARVFRTDKGFEEIHDGTAWRVRSGELVAALADITSPRTSQLAIVAAEGGMYRWTGTVWQFVAFVANGGYADYKYVTGSPQNFPSGADTLVQFPDAIVATSDITPSGTGNRTFTFAKAGVYQITANMRFQSGTASERAFSIVKGGDTSVRYGHISGFNGGNLPWSMQVSTLRRFAAGDSIQVVAYQSSGSTLVQDPIQPWSPPNIQIAHLRA